MKMMILNFFKPRLPASVTFWFTISCFLSCNLLVEARFSLGIDYLEETNFSILKGKKVGLLTHPAGLNSKGISTVDVLRRTSQVDLLALFGPEQEPVYLSIRFMESIENQPQTCLLR